MERKIVMALLVVVLVFFSGCVDNEQEYDYQNQQTNRKPSSNNHGGGGGGSNSQTIHDDAVENETNRMSISPVALEVSLHDVFEISVLCEPVQSVKGWEFALSFDPVYLQAIEVVEGDLFRGFTTFFTPSLEIDNVAGTIKKVYGLILGQGNTSRSGTLVTITFEGINSGMSQVDFTMAGLANETEYVPLEYIGGTVEVT